MVTGIKNVGAIKPVLKIPALTVIRLMNYPESMGMSESNHTSRSIRFDVSAQLRKAGYECIRATGSTRPVDLIAWSRDQILFLRVRRSRSCGITSYTEDISSLTDLVKSGVPGKVYFWLLRSGLWYRYQIMPGGAMPIEWGA